ncbi:hypothetical protein L195_g054376 [Trifolium pratense]|uniref:Uncharacterized protein n=1 Tax=Trifolium pratense TaxID=57577 RepID=A0A2K3KFQ5_TRIPR|nr:hypothetical protein L195_g054376 [Trifolium pratense]
MLLSYRPLLEEDFVAVSAVYVAEVAFLPQTLVLLHPCNASLPGSMVNCDISPSNLDLCGCKGSSTLTSLCCKELKITYTLKAIQSYLKLVDGDYHNGVEIDRNQVLATPKFNHILFTNIDVTIPLNIVYPSSETEQHKVCNVSSSSSSDDADSAELDITFEDKLIDKSS